MRKIKDLIQQVYDECTTLYEQGGVSAVCDHVTAQQVADNPMYEEVKYKYCTACEAGQPVLNDVCLVCGSSTAKPKVIMYGDRIDTVGQLRVILSDLDDHDQICIEAIDLQTGDVQDLYPMNVDVIEGIKLTDDTIVREVRFCQMMNSEPDTRDKQPLVDRVIDCIEKDMIHGDVTVLDELLLKLPWEILKHALPEEMWKDFDTENVREALIDRVMSECYGDDDPKYDGSNRAYLQTLSDDELQAKL